MGFGFAADSIIRNCIPLAVLLLIVYVVSYALVSLLIPGMLYADFVIACSCSLWAVFVRLRQGGGR